MPYPPESSWNLPPTAEQIESINRAGHILGKEEITERNMPETRWQARDLMREWWAEVRDKPRVKSALILMKKSNPGSYEAMRLELIKLNTDLLDYDVPELEPMFRESLELAVAHANTCNLYEAIKTYEYAVDMGELLRKRAGASIMGRVATIEDLAVKAIIEGVAEECGCKLQIPEKEKEE